MESKGVLRGESSSSFFLESDAKHLSSIVEVDTDQLEKYLGSMQEKLAKHDTICESFPILSRKLDLCLLDVDVIRQKFYQDMHNQQQQQNAGPTSDPRSGPESGISSGSVARSGPGSSQEYRRYTDVLGFLRGELEALRIVTRRIEMHQAREGEVFGDISDLQREVREMKKQIKEKEEKWNSNCISEDKKQNIESINLSKLRENKRSNGNRNDDEKKNTIKLTKIKVKERRLSTPDTPNSGIECDKKEKSDVTPPVNQVHRNNLIEEEDNCNTECDIFNKCHANFIPKSITNENLLKKTIPPEENKKQREKMMEKQEEKQEEKFGKKEIKGLFFENAAVENRNENSDTKKVKNEKKKIVLDSSKVISLLTDPVENENSTDLIESKISPKDTSLRNSSFGHRSVLPVSGGDSTILSTPISTSSPTPSSKHSNNETEILRDKKDEYSSAGNYFYSIKSHTNNHSISSEKIMHKNGDMRRSDNGDKNDTSLELTWKSILQEVQRNNNAKNGHRNESRNDDNCRSDTEYDSRHHNKIRNTNKNYQNTNMQDAVISHLLTLSIRIDEHLISIKKVECSTKKMQEQHELELVKSKKNSQRKSLNEMFTACGSWKRKILRNSLSVRFNTWKELNKGENTVIVENTNKTFSKGENDIGSKSEIGNKNDENIKIDKLSESKFVQKANERKSKEKSNQKERIFRHYAEDSSTKNKAKDFIWALRNFDWMKIKLIPIFLKWKMRTVELRDVEFQREQEEERVELELQILNDKVARKKLIATKWYHTTFPKIDKYFRKWIRCVTLIKSGLTSMKKKKYYESAKNLYDVKKNEINEDKNENECNESDCNLVNSDNKNENKSKNNSALRVTQTTTVTESVEMISLEEIVNRELHQIPTSLEEKLQKRENLVFTLNKMLKDRNISNDVIAIKCIISLILKVNNVAKLDCDRRNNEELEKTKCLIETLTIDVNSEKKKIVLMSEVFNKTEKKVMSIKLESEEIFSNHKKDFAKLLADTVGNAVDIINFKLSTMLLKIREMSEQSALWEVQFQKMEEKVKTIDHKMEKLLLNYGEQLLQIKALELGHLNYMQERVVWNRDMKQVSLTADTTQEKFREFHQWRENYEISMKTEFLALMDENKEISRSLIASSKLEMEKEIELRGVKDRIEDLEVVIGMSTPKVPTPHELAALSLLFENNTATGHQINVNKTKSVNLTITLDANMSEAVARFSQRLASHITSIADIAVLTSRISKSKSSTVQIDNSVPTNTTSFSPSYSTSLNKSMLTPTEKEVEKKRFELVKDFQYQYIEILKFQTNHFGAVRCECRTIFYNRFFNSLDLAMSLFPLMGTDSLTALSCTPHTSNTANTQVNDNGMENRAEKGQTKTFNLNDHYYLSSSVPPSLPPTHTTHIPDRTAHSGSTFTACLSCKKPLIDQQTTKRKSGITNLPFFLNAFNEEMSVLKVRAQANSAGNNLQYDSYEVSGRSNLISTTNSLRKYTSNSNSTNLNEIGKKTATVQNPFPAERISFSPNSANVGLKNKLFNTVNHAERSVSDKYIYSGTDSDDINTNICMDDVLNNVDKDASVKMRQSSTHVTAHTVEMEKKVKNKFSRPLSAPASSSFVIGRLIPRKGN